MTDTSDILSFGNIKGLGLHDSGIFKASKDLFGWKNRRTNATYHYKPDEISAVQWIRVGNEDNSHQLRLFLKEKKDCIYFTGFRSLDFPIIEKHFKTYYNIIIKEFSVNTQGSNWGNAIIENDTFCIKNDDKILMYIPTTQINQIALPSKSEMVLEFSGETNSEENDDKLVEIRFFIPNIDQNETDNSSKVELLRNQLTLLSGIGSSGSVDKVCRWNDIHLIVPRGRYEIEVLVNSMKLHGKSFDYTILYQSISRMFLLPRPGVTHINLVIALETPVRQGNTKYPFIVIQFDTQQDEDIEIPLNLSEKEIQRFNGLSTVMVGRFWDIVTRIFKALTGRPIVVPGDFRSASSYHCIRCSFKAQDGLLYPLNRSFIFITKPVIMIRYDEILNIEFSRMSGNQTRFFELFVTIKGGGDYSFTSIDKAEYNPLIKFLQEKNIRIRNLQEAIDNNSRRKGSSRESKISNKSQTQVILGQDLPSDDEDDEDFENNEETDSSEDSDLSEDSGSSEGDEDSLSGQEDVDSQGYSSDESLSPKKKKIK
ncbi:FACT complex subunit SSRP1, putative [Cryptosporidium muris RN66]|uniref:FACT complex subunit SSRP1 n=1 Tax=Cryptosporidium muris (strain RN66) TaxID=441375 RepID=B6ACD0_CRYMR|nr:FACT complex subunit SSRP1, putative [Cryptosporidium muris RN66]EEA06186.1 FACT complex subunit SSRP1, putative [Cryptosporidium muris RN66]|eukprot:XP_002140535.1 FACT complex subunit SSRP1 [Cryptosporidium muris RN66]